MGERASDAAYRVLLEMITDLRLAPGTFINEQALASELEFGRMPVREALAQLAKDRFVTILPRRGTVVTAMALEDVLDMFEAREAVECGIAYIAATRATKDDLASLRRLVDTVNRDRDVTDSEQFLKDDHAVQHPLLAFLLARPTATRRVDALPRGPPRSFGQPRPGPSRKCDAAASAVLPATRPTAVLTRHGHTT